MAHVKIPHKHSELIKAKADNMDLVVFVKVDEEWRETKSCNDAMMFFEGKHYFLCLPQHKEAVINLLNGGDSEINYGKYWEQCNCGVPVRWSENWWYMDDKCESRIKPRKEKRWIAVKWGSYYVLPKHYETKEEAEKVATSTMIGEFQYKEIEIEV